MTTRIAFQSEGFTRFFAMLDAELDDAYFATVDEHLKRLRFRGGVLISAQLGKGNEGTDYLLHWPNEQKRSLAEMVRAARTPVYSFRIHPRDEHGARALADLRDRGLVARRVHEGLLRPGFGNRKDFAFAHAATP